MTTVAVSVPSGAHHRSLLLPLRDLLLRETDWSFYVVSPGSPWADELFPASVYPRERFSFLTPEEFPEFLAGANPSLLVTTTAGLDPVDSPLLKSARAKGVRTTTFVESWDNVWKMERVARGRGRPGQRIALPDHLLVWNSIMRDHLLRAFKDLRPDQISVTGAPRLDLFGPKFAAERPSRETTLRAFGLDPSRPVLHLATTELYDHSHVAHSLADARRRGALPSELQLFASVHPGGRLARHQPWAQREGFLLRFSPGRREHSPHADFRYNPTREEILLHAAFFCETDVAVNLSSTVALESCLADRPVVCAFFGKPFDWWRWKRSMVVRDFREHYADLLRGGGVAVARSPRELVAHVRAYLEDPAKDRAGRRRSAEKIAHTLAGDARSSVLVVLRNLLA